MQDFDQTLYELCRDFDDSWNAGSEPPHIGDVAGKMVSSDWSPKQRAQLLRELIAIDMEHRWRLAPSDEVSTVRLTTNERCWPLRPRVEDYLQLFPNLAELPSIVTELLLDEMRVRTRWGDEPGVDEFLQRFPHITMTVGGQLRSVQADEAEAQREQQLRPATLLADRFQLVRSLGRGGFAEVWQAHDVQLDRSVAVKIPHQRLTADQIGELATEAQKVASLSHPHIVLVHDVAENNGVPFIVSQLVNGIDLAQVLRQRTFPLDEAARIVSVASRAVQHAHDKELVHGDIKPGNILLDEHGQPQVTDFGMAVRTGPGVQSPLGGTPCYMAAEQFDGHVTPRSDVYALAAVLFELTTGRRANFGTNLEEVRDLAGRETTPPRSLRPSIPIDLQSIILKGLRPRPASRYASAGELADDLDRWLGSKPVQARPPGKAREAWMWAKRNPVPAALGSVALGLLLTVAVVSSVSNARLRAANQRRVQTAINGFLNATPSQARVILDGIREELPVTVDMLPENTRLDDTQPAGHRLKLLQAINEGKPVIEGIGPAIELLDDPREVLLVRDIAEAEVRDSRGALWEAAEEAMVEGSLNRLALLAAVDPASPKWNDLAEKISRQIVNANPLHSEAWIEVYLPIASHLQPPLTQIYLDETDEPTGEAAARYLAHMVDSPEARANLVADASPRQLDILLDAQRAATELKLPLQSIANTSFETFDSQESLLRSARRRAFSEIALLRMGQPYRLLEILSVADGRPEAAAQFIHGFRSRRISAALLWDALRECSDANVRFCLILAIGEFDSETLGNNLRDAILGQLVKWYQSDPDPGIHAACNWLLRTWGQGNLVNQIDQQDWPFDPQLARRWFVETVAGRRSTFTVVLPGEFWMGSPDWELGRQPAPPGVEAHHRVQMTQPYAICAHEVTIDQFAGFLNSEEGQESGLIIPSVCETDDHPMVEPDWMQAVVFCRWLNRTHDLPQPYNKINGDVIDMAYLDDLGKPGFRLPTEAEWEFACRGGFDGVYVMGSDPELVSKYAWHALNSRGAPLHQVGLLRPNRWGLFDVLGHAYEWCSDAARLYPVDRELTVDPVGRDGGDVRMLRGAFVGGLPEDVRCAHRSFSPAQGNDGAGGGAYRGLRLTRTLTTGATTQAE